MAAPLIMPLNSVESTLYLVGGKGASLAALAQAGLPVPAGFMITTESYRAFVQANQLQARIRNRLDELDAADPTALQQASTEIRAWFSEGDFPEMISDSLLAAFANLDRSPVAVRSSATAEDLPDMSFAGQQDTFLNIIGDVALQAAVINCWSSLWTARAIGYRARNNVPQDDIALAVIVQVMVQAEAAGVMFTANPLTGLRSETVIDAALGLGQALVGGHVEPDHYVIDSQNGRFLEKTIGAKAIAVRSKPEGGVVTETISSGGRPALPDQEIRALAALGEQVAGLYESPQDIEWAWADGRFYLLQSRPITSLYPLPEGMEPDPLTVLFSFGAIQGLLDPLSPLGQDVICLIIAGGGDLFGYKLDHKTQGALKTAGERLWANMTPMIQHPLAIRVLPRFLGAVDPVTAQALLGIMDDPGLGPGAGRLRLDTFWRFARFIIPMGRRIMHHMRSPDGRAVEIQRRSQAEIARLQKKLEAHPADHTRLTHHIAFIREIRNGFIFGFPEIMTAAVAGLIPFFLLGALAKRLTGSSDLALEITRGLPHNVTTQMDLVLWETARTMKKDVTARAIFDSRTAAELTDNYLQGELPEIAQEAVGAFLQQYGARGIGEIDIGRSRWHEDPAQLMQVLQSYLRIDDVALAPDAVFKRGEQAAAASIAALEAAARQSFAGRLMARLVRALARRVRALAGLRESPKFHIIQMMGLIRQGLLESGAELARSGVIDRPEDMFFLHLEELEALASGKTREWKRMVEDRRSRNRREKLRRQIPRVLLSDGRAFYERLAVAGDEAGVVTGTPVSPGVVEGRVRVVFDPRETNLAPGEILVCPGTDPAWTPLFLAAGGLVMEVGGLITHGAIVAREYGIPAVVGVHQATTRLQTGQHIRVDGSTGRIVVLDEKDFEPGG